MKIALLIPNLNGGGAEHVMVHLANGFSIRGFQVDLVLGNAIGPFLSEVRDSVTVVNLNKPHMRFAFVPLVQYLRKEKPAVLISAPDHANRVALVASFFACSEVRIIPLVQFVYSAQKRKCLGFGPIVHSVITRWLYSCADAIVADSQGSAEDIIRWTAIPRHLFRCIYNPVIDDRMMALAKEPIEHPFFSKGAPPVILGMGCYREVKDYPNLIKAFSILRKKRSCHLMILGQGTDRSSLKQLVQELRIEKDVYLAGFVVNQYAYMARSAIFVISSKSESMSLVLVEALALGVSVVATDCDYGPREILQNGKYGRLVPVGDEKAMADALQLELENPQSQMPKEVLRPFTTEGAVDKYLSIINELVNKQHEK